MEFHLTLRKYRVIYIIVTGFFLYIGFDAWDWFKNNHKEMSEAAAAGFISIYVTVIGVLKFVLENNRAENKHSRETNRE